MTERAKAKIQANMLLNDKMRRLDSNSRLGTRKGTPLEPLSILIPQTSPHQINSLLSVSSNGHHIGNSNNSPQAEKNTNHFHSNHQNLHHHNNHNNHNQSSHPNHQTKNISIESSNISRTVAEMEHQLTELRHMFDGTDPLEQRLSSAIKIQTTFRAYSVRKKVFSI